MPVPTLGVLGDIVEDVVCWLGEDLRPGTDTPTRIHRRQGGSAANVAVMAAASGVAVRFLGCVGDDAAGAFVAERLRRRGVDVRLQRGSRTGTIVVVVRPDGERDMLPDRGACSEMGRVDPAWLAGLAALHLTSYSLFGGTTPGAAYAAAETVRARGGWISLDASSTGLMAAVGMGAYRDCLRRLRPDVLFANADEAAALRLEDAGALPAGLVVIKRGADPAVLLTANTKLEVGFDPVTVRDSTGAGDAFAAGFLAAAVGSGTMIASASPAALRAWAEAGHRAAASVLGSPGAGPADD